ncbi:MAG: glycosyltransferase [Elusimicrobiota bacterium]|nr:glycosyltransferase [Elusimicrobiota bacterium]
MSRVRPAVSVLIPTHDRLEYLPRTLESVYAQTFGDFEVVVSDDGSTDGTARWLRARRWPRLRVVRSVSRRGPAAARNAALARARGEFIAFLDSDDLWEPGYLAALCGRLRRSRAQVACSDMCTIDSAGRVIRRDFYRRNRKVRDPRFEALSGLPFCPGLASCVVRRAAFDEVGGFDEGFRKIHDDRDLLYRLARRYGRSGFVFVPRNLARHRRHEDQMTGFVERGARYLPAKAALERWSELPEPERDLILDVVYFSAKQDCRHCDRQAGGTHAHAPTPAGRSRIPARAP